MAEEKGLQRTYGRGAGEREYHEIREVKGRRRFISQLADPRHGKYPQTGVYAAEDDVPTTTDPLPRTDTEARRAAAEAQLNYLEKQGLL